MVDFYCISALNFLKIVVQTSTRTTTPRRPKNPYTLLQYYIYFVCCFPFVVVIVDRLLLYVDDVMLCEIIYITNVRRVRLWFAFLMLCVY